MQYFDKLAILSGAILVFSVPAFTLLRSSGRTITYPHLSLGFVFGGWVCLFLAITGSATVHYLLVEFYAIWTTEHERSIQSVLFHNVQLMQKRLMRIAGGDLDQLRTVPPPTLSFQPKPLHSRIPFLLAILYPLTIASCIFGTVAILVFLIFSSSLINKTGSSIESRKDDPTRTETACFTARLFGIAARKYLRSSKELWKILSRSMRC